MLALAHLRLIASKPLLLTTLVGSSAVLIARPFTLGAEQSSRSMATDAPREVQKSEDEWRAVLNKEQFRVLRQQGTEMAGTGEFDKHYPTEGIYTCAGCGTPLYKATHKFKSGCGWPAFFDALPGKIERHTDTSWGMKRIEIVCKACGGHLGHVFENEGYKKDNGERIDERHCVNSVSLKFSEDDAPVQAAVSNGSLDTKAKA